MCSQVASRVVIGDKQVPASLSLALNKDRMAGSLGGRAAVVTWGAREGIPEPFKTV